MKYILDFDRVLFSWDAYAGDVKKRGLEHLLVHPDIWDVLDPDDYYYEDTLSFLGSQKKEDLEVISAITPSYGPHAGTYQKRKIERSSIHNYVAHVTVMEGNKAPYVEKIAGAGRAIFVDDKLDNLTATHELCPAILCIQLVRVGGSLESGISTSDDIPVVHDLEGVNAIMRTL